MALTTTGGSAILRPEDVAELLIQPVQAESVAAQVSTVVLTESKDYRIPRVTADPLAAWVAEGAEITPPDPTISEIVVTPAKLAGLTIISRELADDASPKAAEVVGAGLARDLATRLDQAFFAGLAAPAPPGLATLAGTTAVAAPLTWTNLDPFAAAINQAERLGVELTAFVVNPDDALQLGQLKSATGSNEPLLGTDATSATVRRAHGVPLVVSPHVAATKVWGIARPRVFVVIREPARIETDSSVFFTSDRVAVRATIRAGFGFPHPAAVMQMTQA